MSLYTTFLRRRSKRSAAIASTARSVHPHYDAPEFFLEPVWRGKRPFAVLALQGDEGAGVFTGTHEGGETWCGLMLRPQACIAEDASRGSVVDSLAQGLLAEAGSEKTITVHACDHSPLQALERYGFRRCGTEGDVVLDLRLGPETLFRQFHESRRRNIRLATRKEVEVSIAPSEEDIGEFYRVYSQWRHTERKEIHHNLSFEVFLDRYSNKTSYTFFFARHAGKIVAGVTVRAYPGGLVKFANNSSLDEFLHLRPSDLLQWRIIEWACASGYSRVPDRWHENGGGDV